MRMRRSGSRTGSELSKSASKRLKIAVLAPMPRRDGDNRCERKYGSSREAAQAVKDFPRKHDSILNQKTFSAKTDTSVAFGVRALHFADDASWRSSSLCFRQRPQQLRGRKP